MNYNSERNKHTSDADERPRRRQYRGPYYCENMLSDWSLKQGSNVPNSQTVFFKSVNNSRSYHKRSAQLCHQGLVEQLQQF